MRGSLEDVVLALEACCHTLRGAGVGEVGAFDVATRDALNLLVALEALAPRRVDLWLSFLADAEETALGFKVV